MPSETLSHGPARSYASLQEAVLQAFEAAGKPAGFAEVTTETRLDAIGIDELDFYDLIESVAEDLGERGMAAIDGSELAECETIGDVVELLAGAVGLYDPDELS
jgi:hypothetical protein